MPALVAPLVGFALGTLLALYGRLEIERQDEHAAREARNVVALFAALVFGPVTAYFVIFAGDWSLAYLAEARAVPSAIGLVWVVASAAAVSMGFGLAASAVRRRARRELVALVSVPLSLSFIVIVALFPELQLEGSTVGVRGHFATRPVAGSLLGWAILWMDAMIAAGFALTRRAMLRESVATAAAPTPAPPTPTKPAGQPAGRSATDDARGGADRRGDAADLSEGRPRLLGRKRARGAG